MEESLGFHETTKNEIPTIINFNPEKITLLLDIDRKFADLETKKDKAELFGLHKKNDFHLTIIGSDTGKKIGEYIATLDKKDGVRILNKIYSLAESTQRKIILKHDFLYIEKDYEDRDPNDPEKIIHEKRQSIIQEAEVVGIKEFYDKMNAILKTDFEIPRPHITLYTTSTREDKQLRGIGIYSKRQLNELRPQKI